MNWRDGLILCMLLGGCSVLGCATTVADEPRERSWQRAGADSARAAPADDEVTNRLSEMIDVGEKRVFGPDGPQYELPQSYFAYARKHAAAALPILEDRVASSDGLHRMNAIEFLAELASEPAAKDDSIRLIRERLDDEAEFVRQYASSTLQRIGGPMTNDTVPMWGTEDLLTETFDSLRDFDRLGVGYVEAKDMAAVLAQLRQMPNLTTLQFFASDLSGVDENSPVPAKVRELGIAYQGKVSQGTLRWLAQFPEGVELVFSCDVRKLSFDDLGSFTWITFDNCEISRSALKLVGDPKIGQVTFKEVTLADER